MGVKPGKLSKPKTRKSHHIKGVVLSKKGVAPGSKVQLENNQSKLILQQATPLTLLLGKPR